MDLLEREIALARRMCQAAGARHYEIMAAHAKSVTVGVRGDAVDKHQASESLGLAIRVIQNDRPGFSYIFGAEDERAVETAVRLALASAAAADPEPGPRFATPLADPPTVEAHDPLVAALPAARLVDLAMALAAAARRADGRVIHVHPAEIDQVVARTRLCTSDGFDLTHGSTTLSAGALALAADGPEQEMGWDNDSVCFLEDLDVERVGLEAGRKAAARLGGAPVADGLYDVVLGREVAAQFLDIVAESLLGDNAAKGRSLLAGKLGQAVFSPALTIIDDGLLHRGLGSAPFDDEGTPQQRTVLVRGGVLERFVYDRLWAARAGARTTGNAVRPSLKAPPGIGFTNLHIAPGQGDRQALVAELGRGLLISEIMGGHTADPVSGEFSFGAVGQLVENGRPTRPVKSIAMAGQVTKIFDSVKKVGGDLRFFGRTGAPSLLIERVAISGP